MTQLEKHLCFLWLDEWTQPAVLVTAHSLEVSGSSSLLYFCRIMPSLFSRFKTIVLVFTNWHLWRDGWTESYRWYCSVKIHAVFSLAFSRCSWIMASHAKRSCFQSFNAANLTHEFRIFFLKTKDCTKIHKNLHFFALKNLEQGPEYINIHNFT